MNEELKIIINAVTDGAKKGIKEINDKLKGLDTTGTTTGAKLGKIFKGIAIGAAAVVGAIAAVGVALVSLGKNTLQFNTQQAKLSTAFQSMGMSVDQASQSYKEFYRFLGDTDKAVEAASHLAKITQGEKELSEWAKISQGVYATFGDSLPIEGLTEAANETLRVGKVTGVLADALNWAGVSEDEFNSKLAQTTSLEEREALLRSTLNGLYSEAADIYEKTNGAILSYNESQAQLDQAMGSAGAAVLPLMTALNNLGSAFFTALKPALDVIIPALATFVNWIAQGIQAVTSFFSALTGKSTSIKAIGSIGQSAKTAASGLQSANNGAEALGEGLGGAAKAAEEAKRSTQGFDELNVVASDKSSGGGSGGGGSSSPAYSGGGSGGYLNPATFGTEVEESEGIANGFADRIKETFAGLKDVFAPTISAWSEAFATIGTAWEEALPHFETGLSKMYNGFMEIGTYVVNTFVPDIVNSFSTNIAPLFGDVVGFGIKELGTTFEWIGGIFEDVSGNVIIPAMELVKTIWTGVCEGIGNAWSQYGAPLLSSLSVAFQGVRDIVTSLYENTLKPIFEKVIEVLTKVWQEGLQPVVEKAVGAALEIGSCLLDLYNEYVYPIAQWIADKIFPIIVKVINLIIENVGKIATQIGKIIGAVIDIIKGIVQFITGVFTGDWNRAWEGIKGIFQGVWDGVVAIAKLSWELIKQPFTQVGAFFGAAWQIIVETFQYADQWFKNIFVNAWNCIKGAFSMWGKFFSNCWNEIKNAFASVGSWFGTTFTTAWTNIKNAFSSVKTFFSGVWSSIKEIFSKVGTSIAEGIKGAVTNAINTVLSKAVSLINGFITAINSAISVINAIPGVSIKKLSKLSVPKLAEGGIVDRATIAMIGEAGKEAVVPLENNTEWMDKLADKLTAKNPTKVVLQVGETVLGWATINAINGITEQVGGLQLKI